MTIIVTILIFVAVLSLLVFFHEFGHFFAARKLGIKVEEFGIGFPPRLFGFYKTASKKWRIKFGRKKIKDNIDVIYSVNAIPIGGFVKIKGQDGQDAQDSDSFAAQKIWKRAVVLSAGVFMNIVLAWILISIGLMFGSYQTVTGENTLSKNLKTSEERVRVFEVSENSPASEAGLMRTDAILKIDGKVVNSEEDVQNFINESEDEAIVSIERFEEGQESSMNSGNFKELTIRPGFNEDLGRKTVGISISSTAFVQYPWYLAFIEGAKATIQFLWLIIYTFFDLLRGLIVGQPMDVEIAGPVGIANLTGQMARMGFIYLIQFAALLSLNLAVINFLPFPALDGGRLLFLLVEKIKGSPVKEKVEAVFHNVGFLLLMLLIVWVTFKDVISLFN